MADWNSKSVREAISLIADIMEQIHILVVDDEQSIRRLIEKELTTDRRTVMTADSAKSAFKLVRKHHFDIRNNFV